MRITGTDMDTYPHDTGTNAKIGVRAAIDSNTEDFFPSQI